MRLCKTPYSTINHYGYDKNYLIFNGAFLLYFQLVLITQIIEVIVAETLIRLGEKRFYDDKAFPRGFAKSGNFTILEDELLMYYGDTLSGLETGRLEPMNQEEKHFLKALKDPKKANTKLETTWLKYIKHSRTRKCFYTFNSKKISTNHSAFEQELAYAYED